MSQAGCLPVCLPPTPHPHRLSPKAEEKMRKRVQIKFPLQRLALTFPLLFSLSFLKTLDTETLGLGDMVLSSRPGLGLELITHFSLFCVNIFRNPRR